jgi:hypothetical protein
MIGAVSRISSGTNSHDSQAAPNLSSLHGALMSQPIRGDAGACCLAKRSVFDGDNPAVHVMFP